MDEKRGQCGFIQKWGFVILVEVRGTRNFRVRKWLTGIQAKMGGK